MFSGGPTIYMSIYNALCYFAQTIVRNVDHNYSQKQLFNYLKNIL